MKLKEEKEKHLDTARNDNKSRFSIMDRINKVYEKQYSPTIDRIYNKSANSQTRELINNSQAKNDSLLRHNTFESQLPTIPSKYQRIIKEAAYANKASPKLNRAYANAASLSKIRNKSYQEFDFEDDASLMSGFTSKLKDKSNFDNSSSTAHSNKVGSEQEYREQANVSKRSIDKYGRKLSQKWAFGSSIKRFDSKQDLKQAFNLDPGPGTYINIDESDKDQIYTNETGLTSRNYNSSLTQQYSSNGDISKHGESVNSPGFGSKDERFKHNVSKIESQNMPGPGAYDYEVPFKTKGGLINPKPTVSLNFNENNPLNYVRPITVNLYFKQDNPAVGKYKIEKTFGDITQNYWKPWFVSKDKRMEPKLVDNPDPTHYNINTGFDAVWKTKGQITANFQTPAPRKIYPVNLYDPHRPVSPKTKMPGPGHYNTFDKNTIKEKTNVDKNYLNSMKLSSIFIEENTDTDDKN